MSMFSAARRPSMRLVATLLMIGGVASFTLVDTFSKTLTDRHAPVVVMFMQYGLAALMMLPVALGRGAAGFRIIGPRLLVLRALIGVVVSFLIVTSLSLLPFTVAATLLQLETLFQLASLAFMLMGLAYLLAYSSDVHDNSRDITFQTEDTKLARYTAYLRRICYR